MADISELVTVYSKSGASFSQQLPDRTTRVYILAKGITNVSMMVESGGTAQVIVLDRLYEFTSRDLANRTLYFTTVSGENVYLMCEHALAQAL
jgi:hypothetical protein